MNDWLIKQKCEEMMDMIYGGSHRIIAWGIFIFCCGAVYPMIMIPTELRGGIYHRMNQESQTHIKMITELENRIHDIKTKQDARILELEEHAGINIYKNR